MEEPQAQPWRALRREGVELFNPHPESLGEICVEYPALQWRYENFRATPCRPGLRPGGSTSRRSSCPPGSVASWPSCTSRSRHRPGWFRCPRDGGQRRRPQLACDGPRRRRRRRPSRAHADPPAGSSRGSCPRCSQQWTARPSWRGAWTPGRRPSPSSGCTGTCTSAGSFAGPVGSRSSVSMRSRAPRWVGPAGADGPTVPTVPTAGDGGELAPAARDLARLLASLAEVAQVTADRPGMPSGVPVVLVPPDARPGAARLPVGTGRRGAAGPARRAAAGDVRGAGAGADRPRSRAWADGGGPCGHRLSLGSALEGAGASASEGGLPADPAHDRPPYRDGHMPPAPTSNLTAPADAARYDWRSPAGSSPAAPQRRRPGPRLSLHWACR